MKPPALFLAILSLICFVSLNLHAADAAAAPAEPPADVQALVDKIRTKLQSGKQSADDLADELKAFDTLSEKYFSESKNDIGTQVLFLKAMLYHEVLRDFQKTEDVLTSVEKKVPGTQYAAQAAEMKKNLAAQVEAQKVQDTLKVGVAFPDFEVKDTTGKDLSVSAYAGKVVLIDFWATWCPPCVAEMPNVVKAYNAYHEKGFDIIGISLDENKDALDAFVKEHKMTWPQYFDGLGWDNKLGKKYAVTGIPMTYLIGRDGKIVAKNLRGPELEEAIKKALDAK
ncbi:MAG: TlpA family protein disulfide reductase [Chthoniobacterales bacterium]